MLSEPLRWIHAADLLLDHQLRGVGPVPAALRPMLQDATLTAFEGLVRHCLEGQIDFLLLGGRTLEPRDVSLAACLHLVHGCERLAAANIPVFWAGSSAEADCLSRYGLAMPANVIRLDAAEPDPVEFERDDRLIARVHVISLNAAGEAALRRFPGGRDECCEIAWLQPEAGAAEVVEPAWLLEQAAHTPAQYWAWSGSRSRMTAACGRGTAHHPGPLQGLTDGSRGPQGCTLVEYTPQRPLRLEFLPTAPVRWEQLEIHLDEPATRETLLESLWETLHSLAPDAGEGLRLLDCVLHGSGPLPVQLQAEPALRLELAHKLFEAADDAPVRCWMRSIRVVTGTAVSAPATATGKLTAEFLSRLPLREAVASGLRDKLTASAPDTAAWNGRLQTLLDDVDLDAVLQSARQWGAAGFEMESEAA